MKKSSLGNGVKQHVHSALALRYCFSCQNSSDMEMDLCAYTQIPVCKLNLHSRLNFLTCPHPPQTSSPAPPTPTATTQPHPPQNPCPAPLTAHLMWEVTGCCHLLLRHGRKNKEIKNLKAVSSWRPFPCIIGPLQWKRRIHRINKWKADVPGLAVRDHQRSMLWPFQLSWSWTESAKLESRFLSHTL